MPNSFDEITMTQVVLGPLQVYAQTVLSEEQISLSRLKLEALLPASVRGVALTLSGYLLSQKADPITISYPATWWDHVKQAWFPLWALKRWPPCLTKETIDVRRVYLDIPFELKSHKHVINVLTKKEDTWPGNTTE